MIKSGLGKWGLMMMFLVIDFFVFSSKMVSASEWSKTYGVAIYDVQQTTDGEYMVAGYTWSFGAGNYDVLILKLDGKILLNGIAQDYLFNNPVVYQKNEAL